MTNIFKRKQNVKPETRPLSVDPDVFRCYEPVALIGDHFQQKSESCLRQEIMHEIEAKWYQNKSVFACANSSEFDRIAQICVLRLKKIDPDVRLIVVDYPGTSVPQCDGLVKLSYKHMTRQEDAGIIYQFMTKNAESVLSWSKSDNDPACVKMILQQSAAHQRFSSATSSMLLKQTSPVLLP